MTLVLSFYGLTDKVTEEKITRSLIKGGFIQQWWWR